MPTLKFFPRRPEVMKSLGLTPTDPPVAPLDQGRTLVMRHLAGDAIWERAFIERS